MTRPVLAGVADLLDLLGEVLAAVALAGTERWVWQGPAAVSGFDARGVLTGGVSTDETSVGRGAAGSMRGTVSPGSRMTWPGVPRRCWLLFNEPSEPSAGCAMGWSLLWTDRLGRWATVNLAAHGAPGTVGSAAARVVATRLAAEAGVEVRDWRPGPPEPDAAAAVEVWVAVVGSHVAGHERGGPER